MTDEDFQRLLATVGALSQGQLVNRWPASRIDDLMPWAYVKRA